MLKPHSDISGKTTARHDPEDSLSPRRSRFTSLSVCLLSRSLDLSLRVRADARRSADSHFLWVKIFPTLIVRARSYSRLQILVRLRLLHRPALHEGRQL